MPSGTVIPAGSRADRPATPRVPDETAGQDRKSGRWRSYAMTAGFLAPALVFLVVWVVYPALNTFVRSFYNATGDKFVGIDNYRQIFTTDILLTAIRNNVIWVAVVPALVTAIGLIFAVLTERVSWSVAFKTAVFMPMAISLFAAGLIWRLVYLQDPGQGALNAGITAVRDVVVPEGHLSGAQGSSSDVVKAGGGVAVKGQVHSGQTVEIGLTAIPPANVPSDAAQAVKPQPVSGGINGVVWRDFKPGGGTPGKVEKGELGIPGVQVDLKDSSGKVVETATTDTSGGFSFSNVAAGSYGVGVPASEFKPPFAGYPWLGPKLITPAIMIAYIWVWAGFSMVVIGAGLAAIPRDVLEAARTDGGTEWQIFRRVTVPLLAPVLSVVFITMVINVLKVFDIVLSVAPESVQDDANVIALAMWRTSFGGVNDFGLGSAIAVFLFVLVIPVLALNVRRFKREA